MAKFREVRSITLFIAFLVDSVLLTRCVLSEIRDAPPERVPRNVDVRVFSHFIAFPSGKAIFVSWADTSDERDVQILLRRVDFWRVDRDFDMHL